MKGIFIKRSSLHTNQNKKQNLLLHITMATAAVEIPTVAPTDAPVEAPETTSATRSAYRKNFTQKNGCRYVNYEPSEDDVTTFLHRLDVIERLLETKYYFTHVIHLPWRLASDERVLTRLQNIKFNELFETGLVIQLWADSTSLPIAMDIMMNHWGIPTSAIRHECVVDHSSGFSSSETTAEASPAAAPAPAAAEEKTDDAAPSSKRRRGAKGQAVAAAAAAPAPATEEKKKSRAKKAVAAVAAAAPAPAAAAPAAEAKVTGKRKKADSAAAAPAPAVAAEETKEEKKEKRGPSFDVMPASVPPVTGRTLFRPTLEHLLVAEVNVPATTFLKSSQSRLGFPTWKTESPAKSTNFACSTNVLAPQHPDGIRRMLAESLTAQNVPRVLEWFGADAMGGPFSTVGVYVPGWFYMNPRISRRKKDAEIIDLVTLLYFALSKKLSGQALDMSIKLVSKILSGRTNEENRKTYQEKLVTLLSVALPAEQQGQEGLTIDTLVGSLERWPQLSALLGVENASDLGTSSFFLALAMALQDLKADGRYLRKKPRKKRGAAAAAAPEVDENGNPLPPKERPPTGFRKPIDVSEEMGAFFGLQPGEQIARTEVISRLYKYIKDQNLQIQDDKQYFMPDERLGALLATREKVQYFSLGRLIKRHFPKREVAAAAGQEEEKKQE